MTTGDPPAGAALLSPFLVQRKAEFLYIHGRMKAKTVASAKRRILVVDDHPILRKGIVDLLGMDYVICGEAEKVEDALAAIAKLKPDLVIIDLSLKGAGGLDLLKDLQIRHPELPSLVLSMHDETLFAERVLRAGARGYVMKAEAVNELKEAVGRVLAGNVYLSPAMSDRVLKAYHGGEKSSETSPMQRLSDREFEVFEMIGRGMAMREIAKALHLSVKTVETHRTHIKEKLNIPTALELIRHATQWVTGR
jgi:DNA-binding NarL/FixJ family response regulator